MKTEWVMQFRLWLAECLLFLLAFSLQISAFSQDSVCARVRIEIDQQLTIERQAFEARMVINNGVSGMTIDNISVDLTFADKNGNSVRATSDPNDVTAKFYVRLQTDSVTPATIPGEITAKKALESEK